MSERANEIGSSLFAVFSRPPESVSSAEYDAWYHLHARENIESPGFVSAQRYSATCVNGPERIKGAERHLALYRYEGEASRWRDDLTERIATGAIELPGWFSGIGFTSWECTPISSLYVPTRGG